MPEDYIVAVVYRDRTHYFTFGAEDLAIDVARRAASFLPGEKFRLEFPTGAELLNARTVAQPLPRY